MKSMVALILLYLVVLAADWIAPYDYYEQNRTLPYAPPTRLHLVDGEGRWHWRPFVYRLVEHPGTLNKYIEDRSEVFPLRFFVHDSPRRFGPFAMRHRLFGVDEEARILLLGTDSLGRDQFSRLLYGGRISLGAGLLAGLISVGLGLFSGAVAGYRGGYVDSLLMRLGELFMAFPTLFLLIAVRAALPLDLAPSSTFLMTVLVISLLSWVRPARLVRGVVLSAKQRDFVQAARGFGASDVYLLRHHVLPRAWGVVLTHLALIVPRLVLAEITLSFLGLGISEPVPSWGLMLAELRRYEVILSYWWMSLPAIALIGVIIGYHRWANWLRRRWAVTTA